MLFSIIAFFSRSLSKIFFRPNAGITHSTWYGATRCESCARITCRTNKSATRQQTHTRVQRFSSSSSTSVFNGSRLDGKSELLRRRRRRRYPRAVLSNSRCPTERNDNSSKRCRERIYENASVNLKTFEPDSKRPTDGFLGRRTPRLFGRNDETKLVS